MKALIAVSCLLLLATPVHAQQSVTPRTGDMVRIETFTGKVEGRVITVDSDSIKLSVGGGEVYNVAIARDKVTNVWISTGQKRQTVRGLTIGLLAGAGVGALISAASYEPCVSTEFMGCFLAPESAGQAALLGGAVGGVFGTLLGTAVGFATKRHVWEVAGIPTSVGVAPVGNGRVALSVSLR